MRQSDAALQRTRHHSDGVEERADAAIMPPCFWRCTDAQHARPVIIPARATSNAEKGPTPRVANKRCPRSASLL